jgi:hypothetical protein
VSGRPGAVAVIFDEDLWRRSVVDRFRRDVVAIASSARERLETSGLLGSEISRRYEEVGPQGTRLPACVKVYVPLGEPVSEAPFGMVLQLRSDGQLMFIAFGRRHPGAGERDVDERAHRQLHGRFPDR